MNKGCFRLVFSKVFGCLIPVAEFTHSQRKPGQSSGGAIARMTLKTRPAPAFQPLLLSVLLAGLPSWAAAEILLDRNTAGANILSSANGVPVIEIANPNGNGLSHNRFGQFDVSQPGVIFNNSLVNGTSQIGGAVLLNPNLKRTAKAILTEVTGNKPSSIRGTLEVFGDAADLLIAKITRLTEKYPSVSVVFDVSDGGGLKYVSGPGYEIKEAVKAYIFSNGNASDLNIAKFLKDAAGRLLGEGKEFDYLRIRQVNLSH